jgi:hypothetical protein
VAKVARVAGVKTGPLRGSGKGGKKEVTEVKKWK